MSKPLFVGSYIFRSYGWLSANEKEKMHLLVIFVLFIFLFNFLQDVYF